MPIRTHDNKVAIGQRRDAVAPHRVTRPPAIERADQGPGFDVVKIDRPGVGIPEIVSGGCDQQITIFEIDDIAAKPVPCVRIGVNQLVLRELSRRIVYGQVARVEQQASCCTLEG